jgi:hypothetical protein
MSNAAHDERQRFMANLPWWLNRTLDVAESAWMEAAVQRWPWAAQAAERERRLVSSLAAPEPADAELGLQALLAQVRGEGRISAPAPAPTPTPTPAPRSSHRAAPAAQPGWLQAWLGWLSGPRLGPALALVVLLQAGVIALVRSGAEDEGAGMRSSPVTELRTLRVTPAPGVTEAQWRAALLNAGARVVGGPTQLGEYWLASDIRSLAEMQAQLQAAGVTTQIVIDTEGPRGR